MIRKLLVAAAAALALTGCISDPRERNELRLANLVPEYDRFAANTAHLPPAERVAAFEKQLGPLGYGFYLRSRKPERYDERVLKNLEAYPQRRTGILTVSNEFEAKFRPAIVSYEKALGRVRSERPVILLHSLGEMDGGTRDLQGKGTLLFGADVIAQIHAGTDMTPLFHHELFHLQHEPTMGDCEPLWCSLWEEGLATYVASSLNPQAGDSALMLHLPKPIRPAVDANLPAAVCAVVPLLDSEKENDYASLFYGNSHLPGLPARAGYYIGYLVARDLGKTRSLQELAALTPAQVEPLLRTSLAGMANCAAQPG